MLQPVAGNGSGATVPKNPSPTDRSISTFPVDRVIISEQAMLRAVNMTDERVTSSKPSVQKILDEIYLNDSITTSLFLKRKELDDGDVIKICQALATNDHIRTLDLSQNLVGVAGAQALAKSQTLTTLNLGGNQVGDEGAKALAENTTLAILDLYSNQVGDEGAQALAQSQTLTTLNLSSNKVGVAGAQALAENTTLTTLYLSNSRIGVAGALALAENTTLTTLNLSSNQVGDEGAQALAENKILKSLDLSFNQVGVAGALALAENTTLTTLNLSSNQVGVAGAQALAENKILKSLDLSYNQIGVAGAQALAENTTLTTLRLVYNKVGDEGAKALAENTTLTTLDLFFRNQVGDEGARALAKNTTLTTLNLRANQVGDEGAKALAKNTTLTTLNLSSNQVGDKGVEDLQEQIASNLLRVEKAVERILSYDPTSTTPQNLELLKTLQDEDFLKNKEFISGLVSYMLKASSADEAFSSRMKSRFSSLDREKITETLSDYIFDKDGSFFSAIAISKKGLPIRISDGRTSTQMNNNEAPQMAEGAVTRLPENAQGIIASFLKPSDIVIKLRAGSSSATQVTPSAAKMNKSDKDPSR